MDEGGKVAENSKIEWCDHTFNPWEGCTKVSPGCANCYAEARDIRFTGGVHWGKGAPRRRTSEANWKLPLKWDHEALQQVEDALHDFGEDKYIAPIRPRVFCASLADWLDDEVPIEWVADLLALIHATQNLDWLLLTKRPENWRARMIGASTKMLSLVGEPGDKYSDDRYSLVKNWLLGRLPSNVWIGTTVEDQARADQRIPELLKIPVKVRFLSCEPLLGPLEFSDVTNRADAIQQLGKKALDGIHWVICGGESGPNARPMHPDWARSLRDQCAAASVPFLFKQWGEWTQRCLLTIDGKPYGGSKDFGSLDPMCKKWPWSLRMCDCGGDCRTDAGPLPMCVCKDGHDLYVQKVGKKEAGRILDGVEHNNFPTTENLD